MVERPTGSTPGEDQPTPEEQLLRLIETPEEKPVGEAAPGALVAPPRKHPGGVSLKGLARYFSPKAFGAISLKLINRLLLIVAFILSLYLVLVISPVSGFGLTRLSYQERINNFLKGIKTLPYRATELPSRPDWLDVTNVWDKRNVFLPIPKPEPSKEEAEEEPKETPEEQPKVTPLPITDKELEELKEQFKLIGTVCLSRKPEVKKALLEDNKGRFFYLGPADPPIEGTILISGKEISYRLRIKEVKDNSIILIEDSKTPPRQTSLEIYSEK